MLITIKHARECGYCIDGIKDYCKANGIDFKTFIKYGIDSKALPCDIITQRLIEVASKYKDK